MAIPVIKVAKYKIRKEIIEFGELALWGGVKKCQNLTCKVNLLYQKKSKSFSNLFFLEKFQFRSTCFVIDIFESSSLHQFSKFNQLFVIF